MSATAGLRHATARLWWYVREFTGETAYDRYVERHRREHPGQPPLSRGTFERRRTDARGSDPREGFRCC
ncbi:YbdD/YjiX family protein [Streptomyces sp. 549]|uniref:YbdD/YjiX family protein n=1 Tax=Streptomyces sp. 549 TaxID=3049076 RepID=UPI0024C29481|nr:YbdD/YjiX family protein [Streptomyces sp. 549]MDK1476682.1 YbdD/YjiX family protein [Streptomyces sp. 549]